jgi:hypothetical protein
MEFPQWNPFLVLMHTNKKKSSPENEGEDSNRNYAKNNLLFAKRNFPFYAPPPLPENVL